MGAPDEVIKRISTCYWYSVEFGLCRQAGELRAYGAGLLSSFGELSYCLTDTPRKLDFDPGLMPHDYPVTEYQPLYFVSESFDVAKEQVLNFMHTLRRPYIVHYDAYTQCMDIVESKAQLEVLSRNSLAHISLVSSLVGKLKY